MSRSLSDWLLHIERQHPSTIALGLERVSAVWRRMGVALPMPVITVAGTNGKGSTCALLECMLRAAGYRTGLYGSPHLLRYNERVRVHAREATDEALVAGFDVVEQARGETALTYFEYGTLAALWLFARSGLDALILETGLGGRLDAVNVIDTHCAIVTSIGIDHVEYLGATREAIGAEKAGIFRRGVPAIVADREPPASVCAAAARTGARLLRIGRDFDFTAEAQQWRYRGLDGSHAVFGHPALRGRMQLANAAAAIAALESLRAALPVAMQDLRHGLAHVSLPGRFQVLPGRPMVILDVAHNPDAARTLAANLESSGFAPEVFAVIGMLKDKDLRGFVGGLAGQVTRWHLATLPGPRGARNRDIADALAANGNQAPVVLHDTPMAAFTAAHAAAGENDKILVSGSFLTVADVMAGLDAGKGAAAGH